MNKSNSNIAFNVHKIDLRGSNLIEASAGTGKTYSVTLLALRLLLEKGIDIRSILMVTFTKAAVAELDERVRSVIREAYEAVNGNRSIDQNVLAILDANSEEEPDRVKRILKEALLHLDELAIFTIHSFSQQTLVEFAFETGQLFGVEMLSDESEIIERSANQYWRENISPLPKDLLNILIENGLSRSFYLDIIRSGLGVFQWVCSSDYTPSNTSEAYRHHESEAKHSLAAFEKHFEANREAILEKLDSNSNASKSFADKMKNAKDFLEQLLAKSGVNYVQKLFEEELSFAEPYGAAIERAHEIAKSCIYYLFGEAIRHIKREMVQVKEDNLLVSFDDLIKNLHTAVMNSESLCEQIGKNYSAVFIDEFQDTDELQYSIFDRIFGKKHPLFFIGDPKQSIYTWRGADLDTYKRAAQQVERSFSMAENYRSTEQYVKACNEFFTATATPFLDPNIRYEQVSSKLNSGLNLHHNVQNVEGISVYQASKNADIIDQTVASISDMLGGEYRIGDRIVGPSDITILVRGNRQGRELKDALSRVGIPAISTDDATILLSVETRAMYFVLRAIQEPNRANINRALLGPFTPLTASQLPYLNLELEVAKFRKIQQIWLDKGAFEAIQHFLKAYEVIPFLLKHSNHSGERSLSNILQLRELIHQVEFRRDYQLDEIVFWLKRSMDQKNTDDSYLQRIESDKQCISISTIHNSKGLSFPIVYAPFLNLKPTVKKGKPIQYKNPNTQQRHVSLLHTEEEIAWTKAEQEEENRRLIYVALTRAVYKCVVFDNQRLKDSFLHETIELLQAQGQFMYQQIPDQKANYAEQIEVPTRTKDRAFKGSISKSWAVVSFSKLSPEAIHAAIRDEHEVKDNYDQFVFQQLRRGPHVGNFIHDLLERISFGNPEQWNLTIQRVGRMHPQVYQDERLEQYKKLVDHICQAKIDAKEAFSLAEIKDEKCLREMEFYFTINSYQRQKLLQHFPEIKLEHNQFKTGIMHGFVDLLFEHDGSYYILDWKSNYLGDSVDDYSSDKMPAAMDEHNYHLQYLVYSLAVHRYLRIKLTDYDCEKHLGGVLYYFIRGVRKNNSAGIFYRKLSKETLDILDELL